MASYSPLMGVTEEHLTGAHIWKSGDGLQWTRVTDGGFGDTQIINLEGFATFSGALYVSGSKGANSSTQGLGGAKVFRLIGE